MMAHPKKKKSKIPYTDLRDGNYQVNNFKEKDISHTKSDTSVDEEHPCTHLSFMSSAARIGNETGDEEFFNDKKCFIIPKIKSHEYRNRRPDEQPVQISVQENVEESEEHATKNAEDPLQISVLMDEVREEESAQVGKIRVADIFLAKTKPLAEGETRGIE